MGIEALEIKLSGGSANTDPLLSIGGAISTQTVESQQVTGTVAIPGITLVRGAGNATGTGTLYYTCADRSLAWKSPGDLVPGVATYVGVNGTYNIYGAGGTASGYIQVTVVSASLSSLTDYTSSITITNIPEKIFDDVPKDVAYAGQTDYRCLYIKNTTGATAVGVGITLVTDTPAVDTLYIGKVAAAVNTNEATPANRFTAPAGVTFSSVGVAVVIGDIPNNQFWGFWIKRVVPIGTVDGNVANLFKLKLTALV